MTEGSLKPTIKNSILRQSVLALIASVILAWVMVRYLGWDSKVYEGPFIWIWPLDPLYVDDLRIMNAKPDYINQITFGESLYVIFLIFISVFSLNRIAKRDGLPDLKTSTPNARAAMLVMVIVPALFLTFMYRFGWISGSRHAPSIHNPPEIFTAFVALFASFPIFIVVSVIRYMLPSFLVPGRYIDRPKDESSADETRPSFPVADPSHYDRW